MSILTIPDCFALTISNSSILDEPQDFYPVQ